MPTYNRGFLTKDELRLKINEVNKKIRHKKILIESNISIYTFIKDLYESLEEDSQSSRTESVTRKELLEESETSSVVITDGKYLKYKNKYREEKKRTVDAYKETKSIKDEIKKVKREINKLQQNKNEALISIDKKFKRMSTIASFNKNKSKPRNVTPKSSFNKIPKNLLKGRKYSQGPQNA